LQLARAKDGKAMNALIRMPNRIERFVRLPQAGEDGEVRMISVEGATSLFIGKLFPGYAVKGVGAFRVIRDSELEILEEAEDLVRLFETALKRRRRGSVIRLDIEALMPAELQRFVQRALDATDDTLFKVDGVLALNEMSQLASLDRPDLNSCPIRRAIPTASATSAAIASPRSGRRTHRPPPLRVIRRGGAVPAPGGARSRRRRHQADALPHVRIPDRQGADRGRRGRQVGHRHGRAQGALRRGSQHPLGARPRTRRRAGGVRLHRTQDPRQAFARGPPRGGGAASYVHVGTGNYHPVTARIYTDLSFFTADPDIARDVARVFNYMTGYAEPAELERMAVSPLTLRKRICSSMIEERSHAKAGRPAAIWMKMNSLVDPDIIDALYRASERRGGDRAGGARHLLPAAGRAGPVGKHPRQVDRRPFPRTWPHLLLRLRPRLPRRKAAVYISSADMMPRNLDRRVETLVPILNPTVHEQVLDQIMVANLKDNEQSWQLLADGSSSRIKPGAKSEKFNAHTYFMTNPSLSGRGKSPKDSVPRLRIARSGRKRVERSSLLPRADFEQMSRAKIEAAPDASTTVRRSPSSTSARIRCASSSMKG
jgi:polyphosphate kinase